MIIPGHALPIEEYHASNGITSTKLRQFMTSPETYLDRIKGVHPDCNKDYNPRYFFLGQAMEDMITLDTEQLQEMYYFSKGLEPEKPSSRILEAKKPSAESIKKIKEWNRFEKQLGSKQLVTREECAILDKMMTGYFRNEKACQLWGSSEYQMTIRQKHRNHVLQCRFDAINTKRHIAVDLKTTSKPLEQFNKAVYDYRYDIQLAYYSELYRMQFGEDLQEFYFIVCETIYPFRTQVITLPRLVLESARHLVVESIDRMIDCIDSGEFPTTPEETTLQFSQYQLENMGVE